METGFFRRARVSRNAILGVFIRSRLSDIDIFIPKEGNQSITHDTLITTRMSFLRAVISKIQAISRNFDTDGSQIQPNSYILFITLV